MTAARYTGVAIGLHWLTQSMRGRYAPDAGDEVPIDIAVEAIEQ